MSNPCPSGRATRRFVLLFVAAAAVLVQGCDPCAGIGQCEGSPRVAVEGRIVTTLEGNPVPGTQVELFTTGGDAGTSASASTDANGNFRVAVPVATAGATTVDVLVSPPGLPSYRIAGLELQALARRGDLYAMQPWVDRPYFPCAGEAWPLEVPDGSVRLIGERVEFHQTAGPPVIATVAGPVAAVTDFAGRFPLLGRSVYAAEMDPIVGDVALVRGSTRLWARGIVLEPTYEFRPTPSVCVVMFGIHFRYQAQTLVGGRPVEGVAVDFRRVSGIEGTPAGFRTVSGGGGWFSLDSFKPATAGDVTFELTFTPAAPLVPFTTTVTLPVLEHYTVGHPFGVFHVDRPADPRGPTPSPP